MAVWRAAEDTVDTLRALGMEDTCFIGGLAARLYGNDREPHVSVDGKSSVDYLLIHGHTMQDVDILILDSQYDQETIKRMMTRQNRCFFLVDPQTIGADYKVLWYHPNGRGSSGHPTRRPSAIKVDILLPGIMELPSFDPYWIESDNNLRLPTAPLSLVLLHKVRGWWDRINSDDHHYRDHWKDAQDVANLAPIASEMGVTINDGVLPDDFIDSASEWANNFIATYPEFRTRYHWRKIGFRTYA